MKKKTPKLTRLVDHLDEQYGKKGTATRGTFDAEFEAFQLGVMIQELRKERGLTQETYISKIENHASDIRLSTLIRIIQDGLGGRLKLKME